MTKKVLFIQPFVLDKEQLSDLLLVWSIYLENYLKSKREDLSSDLLYLPIEKKEGIVDINFFEEREKFFNQINNLISKINFEIDKNTYICISGTTSHHYLPSKLIAEYFQTNFPTSIIIFGGAHASACPETFNYFNSPIDYIIIGEGEVALYEIIRDLYKKQKNPKIIIGKPVPNLDDLPPLELSLLDRYIKFFSSLQISLSRGCPYNCNFCMEQTLSLSTGNLKRWRVYSPKRAIQEVSTMINYGLNHNIKEYGLYDPTFGANRAWLTNFLGAIDNPSADIIAIWNETRLDVLNEKLLKLLQKQKFFQMYGLESYSTKMLSIMNKSTNPKNFLDKFEKIFEIHEDLEYICMLNILFNHPGETKKTYNESYEGLKKIYEKDKKDIALFNIRYYHHYPGTRVYNNIKDFNENYGTYVYFPNWWENEKLLKNAPYCIRASSELSLRESIKKYTEVTNKLSNFNLEMLKEYKPENYFQKIIIIKKGIKTIELLKNRLLNFLNEYRIELEKESD